MADKRDYEVILFGATGFTGRLVAEYLAKNAGSDVRWAIAGRDAQRLEEVKAALERIDPACASVGVVVADLRDWASLAIMANKTRVVITTVGPYIHGGDKLVRACVAGGADYVDITGEPEFVDSVIEQFDGPAREQGLRIVNCCGFDSIPPDLGALFTVQQLPEDAPIELEGFVQMHGSFSGGTWRSAIEAMGRLREVRRHKAEKRTAREDQPASPANGDRQVRGMSPNIRYEHKVEGWVMPMPTIDPAVVLRSARTLSRYGPAFTYGHYLRTKKLGQAARVVAGAGGVMLLAQFGPMRQWLLSRRQSGEGPTPEQIEEGKFRITFVGRGGGREVITRVSGGDPGYGETSKMVAESALCLALDRDRLPDRAGVLTPAVAMGDVLIERLQQAGIRFEVLESR